MVETIDAIRGMNDLLPAQNRQWRWVEQAIINVLQRYGYQPISFPLVEKTQLFARCIGEITDIVEKEMYCFNDRSGTAISLRPEGTAGCIRAAIQRRLLNNVQRLWYYGPMFRYERPQKGRMRQFHQFGVEVLGLLGPDIDAELIALSATLWRQLGISDNLTLQINSLGTPASRQTYRCALQDYLHQHFDDLDNDSQQRLETNPLRILDSKNPQTQTIVSNAPLLMNYLSESEHQHFDDLLSILKDLGIKATVNNRLVRGLDYYTHTVFEWVTQQLGAQGTICGGGRYNNLVQQLGAKNPVPALGFALGMERLMLLIETCNPSYLEQIKGIDIYFIIEEEVQSQGLLIAERLRQNCPQYNILTHCGGGSIKSQMKKADKSYAQWALILGSREVAENKITIKPLRSQLQNNGDTSVATNNNAIYQQCLSLPQLVAQLNSNHRI